MAAGLSSKGSCFEPQCGSAEEEEAKSSSVFSAGREGVTAVMSLVARCQVAIATSDQEYSQMEVEAEPDPALWRLSPPLSYEFLNVPSVSFILGQCIVHTSQLLNFRMRDK